MKTKINFHFMDATFVDSHNERTIVKNEQTANLHDRNESLNHTKCDKASTKFPTIMKTLLALLLNLVIIFPVGANPVTVDEARQIARSFATTKARKVKGNENITLAYVQKQRIESADSVPMLYVFNINKEGFMVISADDVAEPVLAFCENNPFNEDNLPPNVKNWLDGYALEITWAKTHTSISSTENKAPLKAKKTVSPLVKSTWNQTLPYNDQCKFNNVTCYTGCVPTAMAQIMYFWATTGKDGKKYKGGSTALPAYTTRTKKYTVPKKGALDAFSWADMKKGMPTNVTEKNAVATLMRYCGQGAKADYTGTQNGTGATFVDALYAFQHYFGYNLNMHLTYSNDMTSSEWTNLIYKELANGRPVMMAGDSNKNDDQGHAFICDGYDTTSGKFHFNWGWGGQYDGYYKMSALKPSTNSDYSYDKYAIVNIQPIESSSYAILSTDKKTLTFYYDKKGFSREGTLFTMNPDKSQPEWTDKCNEVTSVKFASSFLNYKPTTTYRWFYGMKKLTNISNLKYLNTSNVTNMTSMFNGCSSLNTIDLSAFNTSNVTNMASMFCGCSSLTKVEMTNFNTEKVKNMAYMFDGCSKMTSIGLNKLNTSNVTSMAYMFRNCQSLKSINWGSFQTKSAKNLSYMFYGCNGLESMNFSPFKNSATNNMEYMFANCNKLKVIDLSMLDFSSAADYRYMFYKCEGLQEMRIPSTANNLAELAFFGVGTPTKPCLIYAPENFNFNVKTSGAYFQWKKGYFTLPQKAYAILRDNRLSFFFDGSSANKEGTIYNVDPDKAQQEWLSKKESITIVTFDPSFSMARPTKTDYWFNEMVALTQIEGMEYLNTSEVTSMVGMFRRCESIEQMDLSHFDTGNVTDMQQMFNGCNNLKNLDITSFNTENVTNMNNMFNGCKGLKAVDISHFNMQNTEKTDYMFFLCENLQHIKLPASLRTIGQYMFRSCYSLQDITIPYNVTTIGDFSFDRCNSLSSVRVGFSVPLIINENVFFNRYDATLVVPDNSTSSFVATPYWKDFRYIVEESNATGIQAVDNSNKEKVCYDIKGVKITDNTDLQTFHRPGIYIINGRKMILK